MRQREKEQWLKCLDDSLPLTSGEATLGGNGPRNEIQSPGLPPGSAANPLCILSPVPNTNVCKVPSGPDRPPIQAGDGKPVQVLLKRREGLLKTSEPGARSEGALSSAGFGGIRESAGWLFRAQGKWQPVTGTVTTSTLRADKKSEGDDGRHLLTPYSLPGMNRCLAYVSHQILWGRCYDPHFKMKH